MTMISFNDYLLSSLMNVIEPYREKQSEIFGSKDVEQVYIFNKKLFIKNQGAWSFEFSQSMGR